MNRFLGAGHSYPVVVAIPGPVVGWCFRASAPDLRATAMVGWTAGETMSVSPCISTVARHCKVPEVGKLYT